MRSDDRRKRGIDVRMKAGRVLCRRVMGNSMGGQDRLGRARREGRSARGP
jgi:hypothetical protein